MHTVFPRLIVLAATALSLGAWGKAGTLTPLTATASAAQSAGDWEITKSIDSVTGRKSVNIKVVSYKVSYKGQIYGRVAELQLGCFKSQPVVNFQFGFQIGSKSDSEIRYRFDDKPVHAIKPHILRGLETMVIENKSEVAQFMRELATANTLYLMIDSMAKGSSAAAFNVAGATEAIDLIHQACPGKV